MYIYIYIHTWDACMICILITNVRHIIPVNHGTFCMRCLYHLAVWMVSRQTREEVSDPLKEDCLREKNPQFGRFF